MPFVATACNLRPGVGKKSLELSEKKRPSIDYFSRPDIRIAPEQPRCEVFYLETDEQSSPVFGKVLTLYDGTWGKCNPVRLENRHFTMGWGTRSECGSVVYEGMISIPRTATTSGPLQLGGLETTHLTFEDHRGRSPQCDKVEAPLILREEAQAADGLKISRVRYAGKATPVPPAEPLKPLLDPLPVCVFFAQPGQTTDRETEQCEVGTYFLEDDGPDGKLVQLEDWIDGNCAAPHSVVPIGRRLYPLSIGKVDPCGTIIYGAPDEGQYGSLFKTYPSGLVFGLEMRDHRFRKQSTRCPTPPALVELTERIYPPDVGGQPILERTFYAPKRQITSPAKDRTNSHGSP